MDKQLIKVISKLVEDKVRAVIKEELTEILREGLQPTINEMQQETISENVNRQEKSQFVTKTAKRNLKIRNA